MTEPTPLIRETADEYEQWMLEAARAERPRAQAQRELAALLFESDELRQVEEQDGIEPAASERMGPGGTSRNWLGAVWVGMRDLLVASVRKPALAWLAVGLVVGAAGASFVTGRVGSSRETLLVPVSAEPPLGAAVPHPSAVVCPNVRPPETEEKPPVEKKPRGRRGGGSKQPKVALAASDISGEVGLLDDARVALAAGDPDRALSALEEHGRRFKAGVLGEEAQVLRIQALLEAGERDQAEARAQAYLGEHADSPHAKRVRGMMEQASRGRSRRKPAPAPSASASKGTQP